MTNSFQISALNTSTSMIGNSTNRSGGVGGGFNWKNTGSGRGRPAWVTSGGDSSESTIYKYLNLIGNPVLFGIMIIGLILAINTVRRRNIRKYSSAAYLTTLFFGDIIWVAGAYLPDYVASVDWHVKFDDKVCMYMQCFQLTGRLGTSFIIIMLALERVLLLSKPSRFVGLAKPRIAMMLSVLCMLCALGISGFYMYGTTYSDRTKKCGYGIPGTGLSSKPQTIYKLSWIGGTLVIAVVLNLILGGLIWRKRHIRASDPIQTSLATARQHTKQLNRINLISFMMVLQFLLTNIPIIAAPSIYWRSVSQGYINYQTAKLIAKIIDMVSLFFIASRAYIVAAASPKIRAEAWLALRCVSDSSRARQLGIDIRPKRLQKSEFSSEDLVSSKSSSLDKVSERTNPYQ